ncbi:MAG TPA: NAD-dependent epimerase/dehydratase family protein [Pyrinomonadaceae bacterium]|jgi:nucleoside-diphosphate-sugar epimerase
MKGPEAKRRILITGASGFVGKSLVCELSMNPLFQIHGVIGNGRLADAERRSFREVFRADIADYSTLGALEKLREVETLVHCAGLAHQFGPINAGEFRRVNVGGTENVLHLAEEIRVRHFILLSSVAVYGKHGKRNVAERDVCRPEGSYAESKLEAENLALEFCKRNNIELTVLRLATVIGEGDRGNTMRLISIIDRNRFLWVGNGLNKKSLLYKTDAAKGIRKVIETRQASRAGIYNLTGEAVAMAEIVETVAAALRRKTPSVRIPEGLVRFIFRLNGRSFSLGRLKNLEKTFEKWLSEDIYSGEKFNEKFGFKPETEVREALKRQVKYYLDSKSGKQNSNG